MNTRLSFCCLYLVTVARPRSLARLLHSLDSVPQNARTGQLNALARAPGPTRPLTVTPALLQPTAHMERHYQGARHEATRGLPSVAPGQACDRLNLVTADDQGLDIVNICSETCQKWWCRAQPCRGLSWPTTGCDVGDSVLLENCQLARPKPRRGFSFRPIFEWPQCLPRFA
jgi:hypothetical protein